MKTRKVAVDIFRKCQPAFHRLLLLSPPRDFLNLRSAWVADPDGNPVNIAQRRKHDNA